MDFSNIRPVTENKKRVISHEEPAKKFSSHMKEDQESDDDNELDSDAALLQSPFISQLTLNQLPISVSRLISLLPEELRTLIKPLPAEITTSFNSGLAQTKMIIALSSSENVEVVIDQYDTAPTAFHISFYGSEQTGNLISMKQNELINILQRSHPNFSFAISPPFIEAPSFSLPKTKRLGYSPVNKGKSKK